MLRIEILYDGDEVVVNRQEISADAERLVEFIEKWRIVAGEPCRHGHKCEVVIEMLNELERIIGGME